MAFHYNPIRGQRWSTRKPNPDRKLNRKHFNHNDIFDDKKKEDKKSEDDDS